MGVDQHEQGPQASTPHLGVTEVTLPRDVPGAPASRDTGSQRSLRDRNRATVLAALAARGPLSQAALARATGLAAGTVSNIVRDLADDGRVERTTGISSGRRAAVVSLAPDPRLVAGIDVGRTHLTLLLADPARRTFGRRTVPLEPGHHPRETLELAARELDKTLADAGVDRERLELCGVAIPASLSMPSGLIVQASSLPEWAGTSLSELAAEILEVPALLGNDADLGALAQGTFGTDDASGTLAYVKVGTGIGLGLLLGGEVYRSRSGLSGEIGHVAVTESGSICYCGHRGCLETVASARRIVDDVAFIRGGARPTVAELVADAQAGDVAVLHLLEEAGDALGQVLTAVCDLLAPDTIVLGGPLAPAGRTMLDALERSVRRRALSSVVATTQFRLSATPDLDEARGACALALGQLA